MQSLVFLIVVWFIVLGVSNFLSVKYGFYYYRNPLLFCFWYLIWCFVLLFCFQNYFLIDFLYKQAYLWFISLSIILFFTKSLTFYYLRQKVKRIETTYDTISKFSEITFQQVSIFLIWTIFSSSYTNTKYSYLLFALLFLIIHLPLLFILRTRDATVFIVSSFFGGLIFSYILSNFFYGIYLTFLIHIIFYVLHDLFFIKYGYTPVYKAMVKW